MRKLESDFSVTIVDRNGAVKVTGEEADVKRCVRVLAQLFEVSR